MESVSVGRAPSSLLGNQWTRLCLVVLGSLVGSTSVFADQEIRVVPQALTSPRQVQFHPKNPDLLLVGAVDGSIGIWDVSDPSTWRKLRSIDALAASFSISPQGNVLASGGFDGRVRLWRLDGSPRGVPLEGHEGDVSALAFSPDGAVLASGGEDGRVRLWNLDGSPRGEPLGGHEGEVSSVAFSPQGGVLASGGIDGTVRLWTLDGSLRGEPACHRRVGGLRRAQ